jgi:predicted outer membrane protein
VSKDALLAKAKSMGADENVCQSIEQLPDEDFQTPADVSQAFGRLPDEVTGAEHARQARLTRQHGEHRGGKEEAREGGKEEARVQGAKDEARKDEAKGERKEAAREHERKEAQPHKEATREEARGGHKEQRYTGGNEFLVEALQDSMAECQICELAIQKSQNEDVKRFAQTMIEEHGRMGRELEELARQKNLDMPREVRREQKMTVDELSALAGRDFEQRWIQYNIDVHERDIKVFRHYAGEDPDRDIASLAKKHGDAMVKHLKAAHDLGKKLAKA